MLTWPREPELTNVWYTCWSVIVEMGWKLDSLKHTLHAKVVLVGFCFEVSGGVRGLDMSGVDGPLTWSIKRPADQRKLCVGPARSDSFMHASLMRSFSLSTWNSILFFSATKPLPRCTHQIYIGLCVSIGNFLSFLLDARGEMYGHVPKWHDVGIYRESRDSPVRSNPNDSRRTGQITVAVRIAMMHCSCAAHPCGQGSLGL